MRTYSPTPTVLATGETGTSLLRRASLHQPSRALCSSDFCSSTLDSTWGRFWTIETPPPFSLPLSLSFSTDRPCFYPTFTRRSSYIPASIKRPARGHEAADQKVIPGLPPPAKQSSCYSPPSSFPISSCPFCQRPGANAAARSFCALHCGGNDRYTRPNSFLRRFFRRRPDDRRFSESLDSHRRWRTVCDGRSFCFSFEMKRVLGGQRLAGCLKRELSSKECYLLGIVYTSFMNNCHDFIILTLRQSYPSIWLFLRVLLSKLISISIWKVT